jgi:5-formyltetrahydrofolate cyclo-ligase
VTKGQLRQLLRERVAAIPPEQMHKRSVAACRLLCAQREYREADVIMIFLSTPREIETSHIALQAWADSKRVLAPRVSWEQRRMLPIEIKSLDSDLRHGSMGLPEPIDGMPIPVSEIDLVIVPGLAFDGHGNRLGRGRGFYDRFLSHRDFRAVACALALEEQFVEQVPHDEDDVPVHMLVTDVCVRRFRH